VAGVVLLQKVLRLQVRTRSRDSGKLVGARASVTSGGGAVRPARSDGQVN